MCLIDFIDSVLELEDLVPEREIHLIERLYLTESSIEDFTETEIHSLTSKIRKVINVLKLINLIQKNLAYKTKRARKNYENSAYLTYYTLSIFLTLVLMPIWLQNVWLHFVDEKSEDIDFVFIFKMLLFPFAVVTVPLKLFWKTISVIKRNLKPGKHVTVDRELEKLSESSLQKLLKSNAYRRLFGLTTERVKKFKHHVSVESEVFCVICLEKVANRLMELDCKHCFCYKCVHKWFRENTKCPTCRRKYSN